MIQGIHTIVCDLDGTLLNSDASISSFTRNTLQEALTQGLYLIIASGRRYRACLPYIELFQGSIGVVCNNGQVLREYPGHEIIQENFLDPVELKSIVQMASRMKFSPILHVSFPERNQVEILYDASHSNPAYERYLRSKLLFSELESDPVRAGTDRILVCCFFSDSKTEIQYLKNRIDREMQGDKTRTVLSEIPDIGFCLEILKANISKWSGIEYFARIKNKAENGIICFGDEGNDIEMLKSVKHGIAMKNASAEAKKAAKIQNPYSNDEDGVARFLLEKGIVK